MSSQGLIKGFLLLLVACFLGSLMLFFEQKGWKYESPAPLKIEDNEIRAEAKKPPKKKFKSNSKRKQKKRLSKTMIHSQDYKGKEFSMYDLPINQMSWEEIDALPGISRQKAKQIYEKIKKQGYVMSPAELNRLMSP